MIPTHLLTVTIEITSAGVINSSDSEGGQELRHSLSCRVVADHRVESLVWSRVVLASSDNEGVVNLHSTCVPEE